MRVQKSVQLLPKKKIDKYFGVTYNIFNKRTVGQCTPDRRIKHQLKIAPYFTRAGALFFMRKSNNKSYDCTKHNYKSKYITVCNHQHQPPFTKVSGG